MTTDTHGIPEAPEIEGAEHVHSGKVRDLYRLPGGALLMVASDRISAYDFVLDTTIPDKGARAHPAVPVVVRAAVRPGPEPRALGRRTPGGGGACRGLREPRDVPRRVRRPRLPHRLRPAGVRRDGRGLRHRPARAGLVDGDRLPEPIFTPATKAEIGDHDENVSYEAVVGEVGAETAARAART